MTERAKPKVSILLTPSSHEPHPNETLGGACGQETTFPVEIVRSIAECCGEYVALLEAGDRWTDPSKLQRQVDFLEAHQEHVLCFHGCIIEYDERRPRWEMRCLPPAESVTRDVLVRTPTVQYSSIMMRTAASRDFYGETSVPALKGWLTALAASRRGGVGYLDRTMGLCRPFAYAGSAGASAGFRCAQFVRAYEAAGELVDEEQGAALERAIRGNAYLAAMAYEKERDVVNARTFLLRALRGPRMAGDEYLQDAAGRLRLYRFPPLLGLWRRVEHLIARARWHWLRIRIRARSHSRLEREGAVGYLRASPNPAPASPRELATVTLEWTSAGAESLEVRFGSPDGLLISRTGTYGTTETGEWVIGGMTFFLQDVSDGLPLTLSNTLDAVCVRVQEA